MINYIVRERKRNQNRREPRKSCVEGRKNSYCAKCAAHAWGGLKWVNICFPITIAAWQEWILAVRTRAASCWRTWRMWYGSAPSNALLVAFTATPRTRSCFIGVLIFTSGLWNGWVVNRLLRVTWAFKPKTSNDLSTNCCDFTSLTNRAHSVRVSRCSRTLTAVREGIARHVSSIFPQIGGNCKCTPCDFWCEDSEMMESHLLSASHREVVSMMNGSVPVVISRQQTLPCGTCDRQFRYNFQLRTHARETGHEPSFTASDEYQHRIRCDMCPKIVRSRISLQRHQLHCHVAKDEEKSKEEAAVPVARLAPYFCSFCSMNFATTHEAIRHRSTSSHKEAVKARKSQEGLLGTTVRECCHCDEKCPNLPTYKNHLLCCHPELCHR